MISCRQEGRKAYPKMLDQQETKGGGIDSYPERVKSLKPRQRQGKENQTRG